MHSYLRALKLLVVLLVLTLSSFSAPSITSIILNSSDNSDTSGVNLTAYLNNVTGNNVTLVWDWRLNTMSNYLPNTPPASMAVILMPFEINTSNTSTGAIRDYSTKGNNATLGAGSASQTPNWTWDPTVGGGYSFDGVNDRIDFANPPDLNPNDSISYEIWINPRNYTNGGSADETGTYFLDRLFDNASQISLKARGGNWTLQYNYENTKVNENDLVTAAPIILNTWQHIIISRKMNNKLAFPSSTISIYVNGTDQGGVTIAQLIYPNPVRLGGHANLVAGTFFNGTIGAFNVYSVPFTSAQAAVFFNSSRPKYDLIHNSSLERDFKYPAGLLNYSVCVYPVNRTDEGNATCSNTVTVKRLDTLDDPASIPIVNLPDASMNRNFIKAFDTLDFLVSDINVVNFNRSYTYPASNYSVGWWEWDQSIHLKAEKWSNFQFSRNVILNFIDDQSLYGTGCIDWTGGGVSTISCTLNISAFPAYIDSAYRIAKMSNDTNFVNQTYISMAQYYNFFNNTRNDSSGLTACTTEESTYTTKYNLGVSPFSISTSQACVDTNVELTNAAQEIANLALRLNESSNYTKYSNEATNRKALINQYLWNSNVNRYQNLNRNTRGFIAHNGAETALYPLKASIPNSTQLAYVLSDLQNADLFNWGGNILYTAAKTDPDFTIDRAESYSSTGTSFRGDIWAPINFDVVKGLEDVGRQDLAAQLAYKTITLFNNDAGSSRGFSEYYIADTGAGTGSGNDGWTAATFISLITDDIFGVSYDASDNRVTVFPRVPSAWDGNTITLSNLTIPTTGDRLTVNITSFSSDRRTVRVFTQRPNGSDSSNHYNLTLYVPVPFDRSVSYLYFNGSTLVNSTGFNFSTVDLDGDGVTEAFVVNTTLSDVTFTVTAAPVVTRDSPRSIAVEKTIASYRYAQTQTNQTKNQTKPTTAPQPSTPTAPPTQTEIIQSSFDWTIIIVIIALAVVVFFIIRIWKPF